MIKSILFVCTGNICRSPMAEGIFRKILADKNIIEDYIVDSAGTHSYHVDHKPHELAQATLRNYNIEISQQKSRLLTIKDMNDFSLIIYMDNYNYECIIDKFGHDFDHKLHSLTSYLPDCGYSEVPDPYLSKGDGFIEVYALITAACDKIAEQLAD